MTEQPLIVGGGPVGLHLAREMKRGILIDRGREIGGDVRCAGLLTDKIKRYLNAKDIQDILVNKPTKTVVQGPRERFELEQKHNYVIDNKAFEKRLAEKAMAKGIEIRNRTEYISSAGEKHTLKDLESKKRYTVQSSQLYGADGPHSRVNTMHELRKPDTMMGWQAHVKVKNPGDTITFYPHIGRYAWSIPENTGVIRVGVAGGSNREFERFLKRFQGQTIKTQHGPIPLHKPFSRTALKRDGVSVRLFGDAAGHIKNTTGGGILPGMEAASRFAAGKSAYGLKSELYTHFIVHNFLQRFSNDEWDAFIKASKRHAEVLSKKTREELTGIMPRLMGNSEYWKLSLKHFLKGEVTLL
ncbi:MAG: FAD-dependent monooxygenase [Candidatus Woesearchaeota archaeon]